MTLDPISGSIVAGELNRLEHDALRGRLRRGQGAPGPHRRGSTSWPAPRASAGPTPSSRWRRAAAPPRPTASAPPRSSASSSATRRCTGASASSRTAPSSPPSALIPWMDSAYFERAIFSLGTRVDVSVRARLFTGGTRRAIELRDRICTHPYCYEPAESCQGDHIEPYAEGGPDHPGERPAALRLPQPLAHPAGTTGTTTAGPGGGGLSGRAGRTEAGRPDRERAGRTEVGTAQRASATSSRYPRSTSSSWSRSP